MAQNWQPLKMADTSTPPPTQALLGQREQARVKEAGIQLLLAAMAPNLQ
jgi:hypothetical protein